MANKEHLAILKQGVEVWNTWREEHPEVRPNLKGAGLSRANLSRANLSRTNLVEANLVNAALSGAYLSEAKLIHAKLIHADLRDANLNRANLYRANLYRANLSEAKLIDADLLDATLLNANLHRANLRSADLGGADLSSADLSIADLSRTNLSRANLSGTDLRHTGFRETIFADTDLSGAVDMETCQHSGPSTIDHQTLTKSGDLPKVFLQGCGLSEWLIEAYKLTQPGLKPVQVNDIVYKIYDAHTSNPVQFYSCFISYSRADKAFAHTLHDALQAKGVRCWLDEHQILPGDDVRDQIDRGINLWDKILLLCSESSLESYWVNTEIDKALKKEERLWKERKEKTLALIPLNLDGYLFTWNNSRASTLTDRHAEDLVDADEEPDKLEHALARIEKALRSDPGAREAPPEPKL